MKTSRVLAFIIIIAAVSASATIILYAYVASQKHYFADEINIWVPATVSEATLNAIVTSSGGTLLGIAGIASGVPGEGVWLVEVPGAKSEQDTERVIDVLVSNPNIRSAEINSIMTVQGE
jgi:hypothetical protein